jgi:hypothetical protein
VADSPSDNPEPSAQGTFASTPLAHVLQHARERSLSGTFELSGRTGPAGTFLVIDGFPAKARTMVDHYLLRVMEQVGLLTPAQVHNWLPRLLMSEELHGRALVRQKVITEEQLEEGLKAQLLRQMQTIVELPPDTIFKYYDQIDNLAGYGGDTEVRLNPAALIWTSLRFQPPWLHVHPALDRLSAVAIRLKEDAETAPFGFDFGQRALLDLVRRQPWRVDELLAASPIAAETAQLMVYCLLLTKQIDFVELEEDVAPPARQAQPPPPPPPPPTPPPPPPPTPEPKAFERALTPQLDPPPARDSWLVQEWEASAAPRPPAEAVQPPPQSVEPEPISESPETWDPARGEDPRATPDYDSATRRSLSAQATELVARLRAGPGRPTPVPGSVPSPTGPPPPGDVPTAAFKTPVPAPPESQRSFITPLPEAARDDGPFLAPRPVAPAPVAPRKPDVPAPPPTKAPTLSEGDRPTAAPPPDYSEPGYDLPPRRAHEPARPIDPNADVYTHSTVQRMSAVTAEEVAAYIAAEEKAARTRSAGPPPMKTTAPNLPRPPTPGMFGPVARGSLFKPPGAAPVPTGRPNVPGTGNLPRPPTPAMFGANKASPREAIVPPEPKKPPPAHPTGQVIVVPKPGSPTGATPEGSAARLALGASVKATVDLSNKEVSEERISATPPLSARKTMEIAVDKALLDATVGPASSRPTVEGMMPAEVAEVEEAPPPKPPLPPRPSGTTPAVPRPPGVRPLPPRPSTTSMKAVTAKPGIVAPPPPPAPPPPTPAAPPQQPTSPGGLTLDLDAPWDDGWDDPDPKPPDAK